MMSWGADSVVIHMIFQSDKRKKCPPLRGGQARLVELVAMDKTEMLSHFVGCFKQLISIIVLVNMILTKPIYEMKSVSFYS